MNSFCIKLFMISILFSTSVSASPIGLILKKAKSLSGWKRRVTFRSIEQGEDITLYDDLFDLSESQRRRALDTIASGNENELYSDLYSHLESQPDLVKNYWWWRC